MNVLVTSGATREPIDSVRFLSNFSTGETGSEIADYFSERGARVTYLGGKAACRPKGVFGYEEFSSFEDLDSRLKRHLFTGSYSAVIHAAAVSDFTPIHTSSQKLSSDSELSIQFRRTFKIVERLKTYAPKGSAPIVVAFKLTHTSEPRERAAAIMKLLGNSDIDFVVHNDFSDILNGNRIYEIHAKRGQSRHCNTRRALAESLFESVFRRGSEVSL